MNQLKRIGLDPFIVLLLLTVALASVLPARGIIAPLIASVAYWAVALLFFLHGARLDPRAVLAGLANWRLQLLVFACTFAIFPLLGLGVCALLGNWVEPEIVLGLLFLAVLPSTVQSSIALTSMTGGNVPAAVCAASLSNLLGVVVTPVLAAVLLHSSGVGINGASVISIFVQILLPFGIGQVARRWIGPWAVRNKRMLSMLDRGSILMIVYSAFSAGVVAGVWQQVSGPSLALMVGADLVLLAAIIVIGGLAARAAGMPHGDRMVVLFCGSTKSLATGVPIANILFAGHPISLIVLPLMLFHQLQLFVCALIAQRYAGALVSRSAT